MKKVAVFVAMLAVSVSASAAGIDSRAYTCSGLHTLIATKGFVYVGMPFQGFAVSGANFCASNERLESRSVATSDSPACAVPYCETRPTQENS
jgi:hypothetical protein